MDHVLAEYGLRLTYLHDRRALDALDQHQILEDLIDEMPDDDPVAWLAECQLDAYDHLVLVTDRATGRYLAFLGADEGTTAREDFLLLRTAFVARAARGQNLMRRMIALVLLRIAGIDVVPSVIAACTQHPLCYRIMRNTARRFTNSAFFPDPDSAAIDFSTAALAQRIAREIAPNHRFHIPSGSIRGAGRSATPRRPLSDDPQINRLFSQQMQPADRMLAIIDLRNQDETTILDDARRLYRSR